jgi:glycosyltransferase involved in cell wall biosynthesis
MSDASSPKVSLLLPVFNGARYLAPAIECALNQSYSDIELILVDDCSTDDSWTIAESFASRDSRLRLFKNSVNKGLFQNYNRCLDLSRGDLIKPFAQDDLLHPQAVERMVKAFEENPSVSLVSCGKNWIDSAGKPLQEFRLFPKHEIVPGKQVVLYNLLRLSNWVGEPSTVMFRKSAMGGGFDIEFYHYGDIEYWFRILEHGDYLFLSDILCSFRRHPESSTTRNLHGMYFALDVFRLIKKYEHVLEEFGEERQNTIKRAVEVIALNLDHLSTKENVTAEVVCSKVKDAVESSSQQSAVAAGFAEVAYQSLRYVSELTRELDHLKRTRADEHDIWNGEMQKLLNSPSWKVTAPLRALKKAFKASAN